MPSNTIDYPTFGDNSIWRSCLEDISFTLLGGASDPNWIHEPVSPPAGGTRQRRTDKRIAYYSEAGTRFGSECHSHINTLTDTYVTFTFEHFPENGDQSTSETPNLIIQLADGHFWEITINAIPGGLVSTPTLNLRQLQLP